MWRNSAIYSTHHTENSQRHERKKERKTKVAKNPLSTLPLGWETYTKQAANSIGDSQAIKEDLAIYAFKAVELQLLVQKSGI